MESQALRASLEYLADALSTNAPSLKTPAFGLLLSNFSILLDHYECKLQIQAKLKGGYCLYCDLYINSSEMPRAVGISCAPQEHFFCSKECFKKHTLVSTNNTLLDLSKVTCPACSVPIDLQQISSVFEGKVEDLQRDACDRALNILLDEEDKERMRAKFTCQVCFTELKVEEGITLECDHRYCTGCIKQYAKLAIENAQVSDEHLKCPNCPQPLTVYEIEEIVSPEEFLKYEKFRLRGLQIAGEETVFHCPGPDCEYLCIIDHSAYEFECHRCHYKCCPQCRGEPHRESTCEQYRKWKEENGQADGKLDELIRNERLLMCPKCGTVIQKIEGCQFITCPSSQCQGRTFLCYDCGQALKADHGAHDCKLRGPVPQPRVPPFAQRPRGKRRRWGGLRF